MVRKLGIVALQVVTSILVGCESDSPTETTQPQTVDPKVEVRAVHIARLADFLAERADEFAASLAPGAMDLGGGPTGTGVLPPEFFTAEYWRTRMNSSAFDELRGKTVEEVVDVRATVALTKAEAEAAYGANLGGGTGFRMIEGDVYVFTPPKTGSPLFDGWFAIYRKIEGKWRVVALD